MLLALSDHHLDGVGGDAVRAKDAANTALQQGNAESLGDGISPFTHGTGKYDLKTRFGLCPPLAVLGIPEGSAGRCSVQAVPAGAGLALGAEAAQVPGIPDGLVELFAVQGQHTLAVGALAVRRQDVGMTAI